MKSFTLAAFALALAPYVAAHGSVHQITIDGKSYPGPAVGKGPLKGSPIRAISEVDPVKGSDNANLACGQSASLADTTVPANPGSQIQLAWVNGGGGNWPHNVGPVMNYMASCGSNDCSSFDASKAQWFKIEEAGIGSNGQWAQASIMAGQPFSLTLPQNLKSGGYLLRHEIISLQIAQSAGGAEFYPSCSQLLIGGNGNGVPDQTVSFPGAYSDTDPGLLVDVYDLTGAYVFPGGPLSNLASPGAGSVASNNSSPAGPASSASSTAAASSVTSSAAAASSASSVAAIPSASSSAVDPSATASVASASAAAASSPAATKTCSSKNKRMMKRHVRHVSH